MFSIRNTSNPPIYSITRPLKRCFCAGAHLLCFEAKVWDTKNFSLWSILKLHSKIGFEISIHNRCRLDVYARSTRLLLNTFYSLSVSQPTQPSCAQPALFTFPQIQIFDIRKSFHFSARLSSVARQSSRQQISSCALRSPTCSC